MIYNKASLTKKLKEEGIFYTPTKAFKALFKRITQGLDLSQAETLYDPTCGIGSLFCIAEDLGKPDIAKYGQDINASQLALAAKTYSNLTTACADTLEAPAFTDKRFDLIVANPPFSIKWDNTGAKLDPRFNTAPAIAPASRADYAFILHVLHYLSDTGYAVVIAAPGILYRGNAEAKIRRYLAHKGFIHRVLAIAPNTFEDTTIPTVALLLHKAPANSICFINEAGGEVTASLETIEQNDCDLTPARYFPVTTQAPPSLEEIRAISEEAGDLTLANLKKSLTFDLMARLFFHGESVAAALAYLDRFRALLDELSGKVKSGAIGCETVRQPAA